MTKLASPPQLRFRMLTFPHGGRRMNGGMANSFDLQTNGRKRQPFLLCWRTKCFPGISGVKSFASRGTQGVGLASPKLQMSWRSDTQTRLSGRKKNFYFQLTSSRMKKIQIGNARVTIVSKISQTRPITAHLNRHDAIAFFDERL
jgi:hypothetical protein